MGLANAVIDLVKSFGELLNSVVGTAYALVHSFVAGVWGLVAGVLAMFGDLGKGAIDFVEGVGRFVVGTFTSFSLPLLVLVLDRLTGGKNNNRQCCTPRSRCRRVLRVQALHRAAAG
jgi:hypothetical protein